MQYYQLYFHFENYRQPADKSLAHSPAKDIQLVSATHELKFEAYDGKMRQSLTVLLASS